MIEGIDRYFIQFRHDPKLAESDRSTWNPGWFGFGPVGEAIVLLHKEIAPELTCRIEDEKGNSIVRREAWAEMLKAANDFLATHRRMYTNQSMIVDMNLHWNNRALNLLAPGEGLPEEMTLGFLKESVGLRPWSGSLGKDGRAVRPHGENYMQLTAKGLTKELGYVGSYGEVLDWATGIYNATRPAPGEPGDPEIGAALAKMIRARSYFRHPALSPEGIAFKPGQESPYAGRGEFYRASYGPFEIGMNATHDKEFTLRLPADGNSYRILPAGRVCAPGEKLVVKPMSTIVLRKDQ